MDFLPILFIIAGILLFYQLVLYKAPDRLDKTGHPVKDKRRGGRIL